MIAFTWSFSSKNSEDKTIKNVWIWTDTLCYKCSDQSGTFALDENLPHGFDKIPIVYIAQEFPEWHEVESLIDRYETGLSKLGASNDYSGYPLLKLYGEVQSMPDRNDDGKTLKFPMKEIDNESGKTIHGDAEFLTNSNAPESVKLEMETLENLIYSLSSTPNLSFDNMKGSIGNISGVALKLLFLDSIIKSKMNEGDNRTMMQRIIKIFISGVATTTNTKLSSKIKDTIIKIQFNSILPDDLKEAVDIVSAAKNAGVMSVKTAVEYLDMTENSEEEITLIKQEQVVAKPTPVLPVA
jgi:SPP1 family phage portal protein